MDRREDTRSHSCDLCGQGFANKKDFEEHNEREHGSKVMASGDASDRPPPVVLKAAPSNEQKAEPAQESQTEDPKAEEPKAEEPKAEDEEEEPTAKAG